ncbi:hemagglutinin repeat-containing protein, partial [Fusobacterium polymorphum]
TYVEAKEVNNRTLGNQLAEIRGNNTTIIAQNNINNIGARISGNENLNLVAIDGNIVNKSTVEKIEFNNSEFDRSKFTKIDSIGEIVSNGNLNILTNNYTSIGAITQAKNANINVANDINIKSQEVSGEQKFGKGDSQYNYYGFERNIGSVVKAENLNTTASDLNISGSAVTTKTANLNVDKLNIESKVDKEDEIRKSSYKSFLKSGSKKETIHNEENSAGSLYIENKGTIKGDVNLVGSNLVLGNDSFVGGKVTTDSRELHSSYSLEEKKKGFSGSIGSGGFSVGYGKSESKLKEKDLTNAKSNLVLGDGTTLNKGADITATNLIHGNISINNGDVRFGARKDVKDVETSSKSSGINLSVRIKSQALDRAKQGVDSFKQMQSGDILGGIASSTNTVTGLVQGLSSNITKKDGSKATLKDIKDGDFKVNNNFYANAGVNLGFNKSSSNSKSHNEFGVVTTIRGKDENSSITYNNVNNIEYVGTQAQNTKFIYNNVENITKKAVELNNYSSSSSKSSGVSAGVTINYNNGFQAEADAIRVSGSKSKMNTNGTTYQNGLFVNVDEVHNNTKNMTLSGFNQEGGIVTGNIQNLTIESKQNTSTTTGSTKGGSIGFAPNGMPNSISANYSQTNGDRKVVDSPTTFIIGDGSNLKVGKVENTAGAIGTTGNGKLSIDEYVGHNLENKDKTTTKGASLSLSPSNTPVSGVGINYANRDLESITKNTVIGNVEIGKSSGDEINKDLGSMTEITKDRDFKTDINIESQTIKYALNPSQFKEDLQIALIEGKATGRTVVKTIDNMINGDKSQDIGDAEKRSLIEIKEAIVRVQTAPAMDIIAKENLADKNVQKELGVEIEKFDPNDPTLSEKVRERLDELKAEGKEIVAFYDKKTGKIFINQNAKDEEVRASIAREYKIKEDLELGRGKENDKGQLRSTVAGEIAYDEIKDRLKKGDKNPISASSFDVAKMDKDSEVTADGYFEEAKAGLKKARAASKYTKLYEELEESEKSPEEIKRILAKGNKDLKLKFGEIDKELQKELDEEKDAGKRALLVKKKMENSTDPYEQEYYKAYYNHLIRKSNPKEAFFNSAGKGAVEAVGTMLIFRMFGIIPKSAPNITIPKSSKFYKDTRYPISAEDLYVINVNDPEYYKDNSHLYKVTGELNVKAGLYNKKIEDPVILKHMTEYHNNTLTSNEKLGYSVGNLGTYVVGNKILNRLDGYIYKNPNSSLVSANKITNEEQLLLENKVNPIQNKVFINDGTPGGTTVANQIRVTDSSGNMLMLQNNLTTGELSFQGISSSGQRIFEKSLTPYPANALIGTSSSSQMLVGNGAVSQVASKLPYNPVLKLPVKYPIKSESGVTIYKGYAIGTRGAKYTEVGVSIDKEIVYKNSNGSYFKLTDKGLENISSKDVIKKEYFPTVKVQKNNGSNPSAGKDYYVSKEGNFKVEKYIEAGQTVEDYDKKYLVENARARGINVGRSKEHTNTTLGHWEKAVDIADEASKDPNVKAVYVDEALRNISDKFKDDKTIPDVTIEYEGETFKLIEVQSKTDTEDELTNKLKNIQDKYGKDVVKEYDVKKPKGGK